jgi:dipeptidyl aminopeptidase/acylaminoacyl peptidase
MCARCKTIYSAKILVLAVVLLVSLSLTGVVKAALFNIKLSGSLVTGGDVTEFDISPDGQYAVFLADARTNTVAELFSVPVAGGERIRLSGTLPTGMWVEGFLISPNSQSVVYWIANMDGLCSGIYVVPIAGGASVNVGESIPAYKMLTEIALTADNDYVVYRLTHHE